MGNGPEFPEYAVCYCKNVRESRSQLAEPIRVALLEVEDQLAEDPGNYAHRTVPLSEDLFIYRHPKPQIELTCKIDRERKVIQVCHLVAPMLQATKPIFISYSHQDKPWLTELRKWLKPLEQRDLVKIWDDREIQAGDDWRGEIQKSLTSARAALLLVSQEFLCSDFIANEELPQLLSAARDHGVDIMWVALSASTVQDTEIYKYQAVNDPAQPLDALPPADQKKHFLNIYNRIKAVVEARSM